MERIMKKPRPIDSPRGMNFLREVQPNDKPVWKASTGIVDFAAGDVTLTHAENLLTVVGVIHGQLPNKSNARRIVRVRGRMLVIKSKDALDFEKLFAVTVMASELSGIPLDGKLSLRVDVHQKDMRRDLDCELLCDVLQKNGIIKNDRAIWTKHYTRYIDRENPRIEFELRRQHD